MKSGLDGASPLRRPLLLIDERPYRLGNFRLPPHRLLVACAVVLSCAALAAAHAVRTRLLLNAVVLEGTQSAPKAWSRCEWVVAQVEAHNANKSQALRRKQYSVQSQDPNMFYRGTAYLFWHDFARGGWGEFNLSTLGPDATRTQTPRTAAWTWITGDQHLSNFGAWRNRNNDVVYGVNDFDEAAIYDFHIDIYRLAVSIYDHALSTSALGEADADAAIGAFADAYVQTLVGYVGNEKANLFEMTATQAASGHLHSFLKSVEGRAGAVEAQLRHFTAIGPDGRRRFVHSAETSLRPATEAELAEFHRRWNAGAYGATLLKVGWHALPWDPEYFEIVDLAQRVDSGDGSFGVSRFYVLIKGPPAADGDGCQHVILDVKQTPPPAMAAAIGGDDLAWWETIFINEGARAVEAQRRLTCYTDPYTGWVELFGVTHVVRQRSPWKTGMDLSALGRGDAKALVKFAQQVATVTATSHARGSVGHSPAQFKDVVARALGPDGARAAWAARVLRTARAYRRQLLLDFECFRDWAHDAYPPLEGEEDDYSVPSDDE